MSIIGIDLGTTHSACAVFRGEKAELIPNRYGEFLTPSVVSTDESGDILVGKLAKARLISHPTRSVANFKRYMGAQHQVTLDKRAFSPVELSSLVLKSLKEDAEDFLGESIHEAVISVPAYFNDIQRKATKAAAELAGFKVERLVNEPTAAAIAYGLHDKPEGNHFMILDLGGGTFDVSIMEYFEGVLEVHASAGDNFLGGEDFLENLVNYYLGQINIEKDKLNSEQRSQVYARFEEYKKQFNSEDCIQIDPILEASHPKVEINRDDFMHINQALLHKIQIPIERALRDSKLNLHDLSEVVLVGGATRMQVFKRMIAKMFRRMPASHLDPDLVVAMGAGIQAGLKARHSALEDVVLTDVSPYSLGIGIINENDPKGEQGDLFSPIIERNSVLPSSRVQTYYTTEDEQTGITVDIFQGESRRVKNNIQLGSLAVQVPKGPKYKESIDVRFSYDMNGLLEVDVQVNSTGERAQKTIENSLSQLSPEAVEASRKKLAALKLHPREDELNKALLLQAEKLYESALGEDRNDILVLIQSFEATLESQDPRQVQHARKEFSKQLDSLKQDRFF